MKLYRHLNPSDSGFLYSDFATTSEIDGGTKGLELTDLDSQHGVPMIREDYNGTWFVFSKKYGSIPVFECGFTDGDFVPIPFNN